MELRHLRYFVAVAETENVSRAALQLHVSQPAVSRQIRDLEQELGFALFERSAKSVQLTDAGRTFFAEAQAVLARATEAVQAAQAVATGRRGELHVGYAPTPTARILPGALRQFQAAEPAVRVKLHDLSTEEMLSRLRERTLHLAVLVQPTRAMLRDLTFTPLMRDPLRVAVAPSHPLARQRTVAVSRLTQEPLLVLSARDFPEYHAMLHEVFGQTKTPPRIREEHESGASLIAGVEAGAGVALMADSIACVTGRRLKLLSLVPETAPLVIGAAYPKNALVPAAERFLAATRAAVAALGAEKR